MNFIVKLLLGAVSVLIGAYILPGVHVENFWVALVVAGVLALLNAVLKPILVFLTIPLTILTLGLFLLVINAIIILLADGLIGDFSVDGFWWAMGFSLLLSVLTSLFNDLADRR